MALSRMSSLVVGVAAAMAGAVAFVSPHSSGLRMPRVAMSARQDSGSFAPFAQELDLEASVTEPQQPEAPWKWLVSGLAAGVMLALCSSAPAEAKPDTGMDWSVATVSNPPWLEPCKKNKRFAKKFKDFIYQRQQRQKKYSQGGVVWKSFETEIAQMKRTQEAYGDRFCGKTDGTPRVIASGEFVRGGIVVPSLIFLYTAGWIGWAGRSYLIRTQDKMKELIIDVPLALTCMASGFAWPVAAWQEIVTGKMTVKDNDLHASGYASQADY